MGKRGEEEGRGGKRGEEGRRRVHPGHDRGIGHRGSVWSGTSSRRRHSLPSHSSSSSRPPSPWSSHLNAIKLTFLSLREGRRKKWYQCRYKAGRRSRGLRGGPPGRALSQNRGESLTRPTRDHSHPKTKRHQRRRNKMKGKTGGGTTAPGSSLLSRAMSGRYFSRVFPNVSANFS